MDRLIFSNGLRIGQLNLGTTIFHKKIQSFSHKNKYEVLSSFCQKTCVKFNVKERNSEKMPSTGSTIWLNFLEPVELLGQATTPRVVFTSVLRSVPSIVFGTTHQYVARGAFGPVLRETSLKLAYGEVTRFSHVERKKLNTATAVITESVRLWHSGGRASLEARHALRRREPRSLTGPSKRTGEEKIETELWRSVASLVYEGIMLCL